MQVALVPSEQSDLVRPLLRGLCRACDLELVSTDDAVVGELRGIIEVHDSDSRSALAWAEGFPSFRLQLVPGDTRRAEVGFSQSEEVPQLLRGRRVVTETASGSLPAGATLADTEWGPVWTSETRGGLRHDAAVMSRSAVTSDGCLFQHLNGQRFVGLLPLLEWARRISGWESWTRPSVRACLMIDDPNLHWTTYGHVSFKELVDDGRRHGFHTSLATIPLDQYYVKGSAAWLLRQSPDAISLLVHGNNHTYRELAGPEPPGMQLAMMRQAVRRIERLERRAGVAVSRVMAPPHGACSIGMMRALARAGFEAACISHGSVEAANPACEWTAGMGAEPTMVLRGLPVIPRFRLGRFTETQVLVSAYLGQPIVGVGHHGDLRGGLRCLIETAQAVKSLGDVAWSDMATVAAGTYRWRIEREALHVTSFSRRFRLQVPEGINALAVRLAGDWGSDTTVAGRRVPSGCDLEGGATGASVWTFAVPESGLLEVVTFPDDGADATGAADPATPVHALIRRGLTEARDRLMPWAPRWKKFS